jgi:hypothetical protein
MMTKEGIQIPDLPMSQQLPPQVQTLSQHLQNNSEIQGILSPPPKSQEKEPDLKGIGPEVITNRKPVGKIEKDWHDYFSNRFGPFVLLILWFITANLEKATFYAPTPEECRAIALPMAKICAKIESFFKVPQWLHDTATEVDDVTIVGMAIVGYLDRIGVLERLVPYYTGLATRMGARTHGNQSRNTEETYNSPNNGSVPYKYGVAGQHATDI